MVICYAGQVLADATAIPYWRSAAIPIQTTFDRERRIGVLHFVADRQAARVFVVTPDGARTDFASFTDGDAPHGLGVAPVTPDTRRVGIAGDRFIVMVRRGAWPVDEIVRISGPLEEFVRSRAP